MLKKFSAIFAIILVVLFFAIDSNKGKILISKANSCYSRNDIKCAQKNFEKAFEFGIDDEAAREVYVNSIITSPFDLVAQEKALRFLEFDIEDSAKLKLEYFLHDLKVEIYRKYSENYVKQAFYNQKILRWGEMPITYGFLNDQGVPKYFIEEFEKAVTDWESALEHKILFERSTEIPNIIISFNSDNPANKDSKKYVVAYTTPEISANELKNMHIEFYIKTPQGKNLTKNQVYNTALHELGHALGFMGHSSNIENLMYMTKDSAEVSNDIRQSFTQADINTFKLLYNIKPDITNSDNLKGEYLPKIVFGDEEDVYRAKFDEAKRYIKNAPSIVAGYIDLAEVYVADKDYPKAIKVLEQALNVADTEVAFEMLYYNLAVSYYYIDQIEIAKGYLVKSLEIKKSDDKRFLLAEIYKKMNKIKSAEIEYKTLISKNPNNIEYVIALTNLYITEKKYLKARSVLKKYFELNPQEKNNMRLKPYGILKMFL